MLTTLLLLSVLHASPDVPLRGTQEPSALALLSPASVSPAASHHGFQLGHRPGGSRRHGSTSSPWRPIGEFFTGFGSQLLVGTGLWMVEVITLFGATFLTSAFTGGEGADIVLGAGAQTMILLNGGILPLLSTVPIWLIASTDLRYSHSFWWTWLSGAASYAAFWAFQLALPSSHGGLELVLWPTHVASWALVALVQTLVINLTKEDSELFSRALSPALLNVDGSRVSLGTPLPMLAPDVARPGRIVPVFSLAQGRF